MYDSNPTIEEIFAPAKKIDEKRQGEVMFNDFGVNDGKKRFYIESYGCAMNFSDSEIVASVLTDINYAPTRNMEEADLILINTCSIREKAEDNVRVRLRIFNKMKKKKPEMIIGVLRSEERRVGKEC